MESLVVKGVSHNFETTRVLDNIDFTLKKGKIISILGASGCGKTTLLQICAGLIKTNDGDVTNSFETSAFVFQEPRLLPWKNLIENISVVLKDKEFTKQQIVEKSKTIALQLGLSKKDFSKFPKDLSGGMKQRVSLARGLVVEPNLLFLDEPFSALDIVLKKELYNILQERVKKSSLSILFITHDLMEAVILSDEALLLQQSSKGSKITNRYKFDIDFKKKDDEFVYKNVLLLSSGFCLAKCVIPQAF